MNLTPAFLSTPTREETTRIQLALADGDRLCKINALMHWSLNVQYIDPKGKDKSHAMLCKDGGVLYALIRQLAKDSTGELSMDLKAMDLVSPDGKRALSWTSK